MNRKGEETGEWGTVGKWIFLIIVVALIVLIAVAVTSGFGII